MWRTARRRVATRGWYRAQIRLDRAPEELWAAYLPRIGPNAAVYVNRGRITPACAQAIQDAINAILAAVASA